MDHEGTQPPPPRPRDPLTEYAVGCVLVILFWLAVSWAAVYIPW